MMTKENQREEKFVMISLLKHSPKVLIESDLLQESN